LDITNHLQNCTHREVISLQKLREFFVGWLFAVGVISLLGQVVLLRELNVAFFGSELNYILALGIWLLWTATGAAVGRRSHVPSSRGVRFLLLLYALAMPLSLILVRRLTA